MNGTRFFHAEEAGRAFIRILFGAFLLFPYLNWLATISDWTWPSLGEWSGPLAYAAGQAALSSFFSMVVGFKLFQGLKAWKKESLAEALLLLPNMIPPLFLVMGFLSLVTPFSAFPYGLGAVVFAHVLMNAGLVAISVDRILRRRLGGLASAAWVMGVKPKVFWNKVIWPLARMDFAALFIFVFGLCMTSFSIPLLLSDKRSVTLEVSIYDAIRSEGRWDKAVIFAAMQASLLLGLAWLMPRSFWPVRSVARDLDYLARSFWRPFVLVPTLLLLAGWVLGVAWGFTEGFEDFVVEALPAALLGSLALGLAVGLVHLILFLALAYVLPHERLTRFLNGYLAPSAAITGFGLLLLPLEGDFSEGAKLTFALTLISFPLLYRWIVHGALASLQSQILVARILGASWPMVLLQIVWPQSKSALLRASGLAAVWACGDFALSGILLSSNASLPLLIGNLLDNYRFEQAALLLLPLLAVSFAVYFFFVKGSRYVMG